MFWKVLISGILLSAPALAGTWSRVPNPEPDGCTLMFEGVIEGGDLTGAVEQGLLEDWNPRICLNSEGGSLAEVYRFLLLMEKDAVDGGGSFATRVRSGEVCLSSCAVLFMFGESVGANSPFPDRTIEPGGRLGFHAPFIPDGRASGVDAANAFRVALDVAKLLADRSYKATTTAGPALPSELLALILGTPSDSMHYVDTIGELELLGIRRTDEFDRRERLPATRVAVAEAMERICVSSFVMTFRQFMVEDGYRFADLIAKVNDPRYATGSEVVRFEAAPSQGSQEIVVGVFVGPYHQPGWFSAGAQLYCRVEIGYDRQGDEIEVSYYRTDFDFTNGADLSVLPEATDTFLEFSAGLVPIDTRYD